MLTLFGRLYIKGADCITSVSCTYRCGSCAWSGIFLSVFVEIVLPRSALWMWSRLLNVRQLGTRDARRTHSTYHCCSFALVKRSRAWRKADILLRLGVVGLRRQRPVTFACVISGTPRHSRPQVALFFVYVPPSRAVITSVVALFLLLCLPVNVVCTLHVQERPRL